MSYQHIDIQQFMNHRAFGDESDIGHIADSKAGISGSFIIYEKLVREPEQPLIDWKLSRFSNYDNINCIDSVSIPLEMTSKQVHILGFSQWSEFTEELAINYRDGSTEFLKFYIPEFSYWTVNKNSYYNGVWVNSWNKDKVIHPYFRAVRAGSSEGHLYRITLTIDCKKEIKSVTLPCNEMIHIFSIVCEL